MEKNINLKILNIISGSNNGGAEAFFERFCISINKERDIEQKVIIRRNKKRYELLTSNGLDVKQFGFMGKWDFFTKFLINVTSEEFKPDIIFSWMNRASYLIPNLKSSAVKVGRLGGYYKIKNYINCDYLITNTDDIRKFVISQGWDPNMVKRINNFVKIKNNSKKKIVAPINNKKYRIILALGRFHENKAFEILIEALLKLENHFLWLLGRGELKADYIKLAEKIGVEKRIKIIDWSENISEYYNNADVLVCPSRVEPLGNIIIEGWCHKIPVVASNIMGPKKLIKHKVNGMKFELENIDELVKCLKELDSNNVLKRKMINNAYKDYQNHFSEEKVINDFKKFFWEIKNKCAE